jgi:hypothetical protein
MSNIQLRRVLPATAATCLSEKADQAIAVSSEIGDRWCLPRTHEIRGRLLLQTSRNADAAEQDLLAAVSVARSQCAAGAVIGFRQKTKRKA